MKIRGERECTDCGTRWSYYETGSVGCPACGSLRSVGTDDRTEHTDLPVELDLTPVRNAVDEVSTAELADRAREVCRGYVHRRGFVSAGRLEPVDDDYLAAVELLHVADVVSRARDVTETEELYFLSLLGEADAGRRPDPDDVPPTMRAARGLSYANAVREFRRDVRTWADGRDVDPAAGGVLEALSDHATRIRMLDGDVPPARVETLVEAARDVASGLRGDEAALANARERLDRLE